MKRLFSNSILGARPSWSSTCNSELGYELVFAEDIMTGTSEESHANSIERIFPCLGRVSSTEEIIEALKG